MFLMSGGSEGRKQSYWRPCSLEEVSVEGRGCGQRILKSVQNWTGSQWSGSKTGVMWWIQGVLVIIWAAHHSPPLWSRRLRMVHKSESAATRKLLVIFINNVGDFSILNTKTVLLVEGRSSWQWKKLHQSLVAEEHDGVDREGPQTVQQEAFEKHPQSFLSETHSHAVEDPVELSASSSRHLEPGFHYIHGCGRGPGHHTCNATCSHYCKRTWEQRGTMQNWKMFMINRNFYN